jgi:hypothetical protein
LSLKGVSNLIEEAGGKCGPDKFLLRVTQDRQKETVVCGTSLTSFRELHPEHPASLDPNMPIPGVIELFAVLQNLTEDPASFSGHHSWPSPACWLLGESLKFPSNIYISEVQAKPNGQGSPDPSFNMPCD